MATEKDTILSEFYRVCGQILTGKASGDEIKASTKAMVDSGQQTIMATEFNKITKSLSSQ